MIVDQNREQLDLYIPAKHMICALVLAQDTFLFGGRGTFKTSVAIVLYILRMVESMPGSTGVAVGLSYEHIDKNTIEPLLKGLARFGYVADVDYVKDKRPPDHWDKPIDFVGNEKYDRTITFRNGTVLKFISLARKAASNAISAQWGFFDEVKFMKPEDLEEVFPIFRGNEQEFKNCTGYLSKFFATDKLADPAQIEWLLKKRELVDREMVDQVIRLQIEVNRLKMLIPTKSITAGAKIQSQINEYEDTLLQARAELVYVCEINCYDVKEQLGEKWFKSAKRIARTKRVWNVAYENHDPDKPEVTFYPSFKNDVHCKPIEKIETRPLIIALDYQHSVSPLLVCQLQEVPDSSYIDLCYVDYLYTLFPEGLADVMDKFIKKYESHTNKNIYYVYDHTAVGKRLDAKEYNSIVVNKLIDSGWNVIEVYTGQAPDHYQKYIDTTTWLDENPESQDYEDQMIRIRINTACVKLIKSINNSPTRIAHNKTQKDKKYENTNTYPDIDQSETTHASDTFDMINNAVIKQGLITVEVSQSFGFSFR